jgi:hypothetical protein
VIVVVFSAGTLPAGRLHVFTMRFLMSFDFFSSLGLPEHDPAPASAVGKISIIARRDLIGELVIRRATAGEGITLDDAKEACGDATTNAVGTLCGRGICSRGGFHFWRSREDGSIRFCRENVVSAARGMTVSAIKKLLTEIGMEAEEFADFVKSLPSARD